MAPPPAMAEENFELSDLGAAAISKIGRGDMSAQPQCAIVPAASSSAEGAASEEDLGFWSQLQGVFRFVWVEKQNTANRDRVVQ